MQYCHLFMQFIVLFASVLSFTTAHAVELQPGQGVQFAQVDFGFSQIPAAQQLNSSWGQLVINTQQLRTATGYDRGYINVFSSAGWTIQNLRVHTRGDGPWLTSYFDLQVPVGTDVTSLSARVTFTTYPQATFVDGTRNSFVVLARAENSIGRFEPTTIGVPPLIGSISFLADGRTEEFVNTYSRVADEEGRFAFAGAIASGFESLRARRALALPYPFEPAVAGGANLLKAIFQGARGRVVTEAEAAMLGQLTFASEARLLGQVSFAHQGAMRAGRVGDVTINGATSTDFSVGQLPTFKFICERIAELDPVTVVIEWTGTFQRTIVARAVACGETLGRKWLKIARDQSQNSVYSDGSDRNTQFFHVNDVPGGAPQLVWGGAQIGSIVQVLSAHLDIAPTNPKTLLWQSFGPTTSGSYGTVVAAIGDITGDGVAEYAAGAPYDLNGGNVRIVNGATNAILTTLSALTPGERYGQAIAGVGDIDGDRVPDFAIGAYRWNQSRGAVRLYSGASFGLIRIHSATAINAFFGSAVAGGRDVDLDGVPDIVVGAPGTGTAVGFVQVYSGQSGSLLHTIPGPGASSRLGQAVLLVPDMDSDNRADIVAGAWNWTAGGAASGSIFAYSGLNGGQLFTANGGAGFRLGYSIADAGDVNQDGISDIIAGMPGANTSGANSGGARIYNGNNLAVLYNLYGQVANTYLGEAVAGGFYHNYDSYVDVAVGAPLASGGAGLGSAGNVLFFSGRNGQLITTASGTISAGFFGTAIAEIGDVNGDGLSDYAISSPGAPNGGNVGVFSGENLTEVGYGCSASSSAPRIYSARTTVSPGATVNISGVNAPPNATIIMTYALATQSIALLPGGCATMSDFATLDLSTIAVADRNGNFSATITIPTGSLVTFARFAVQAAVLPSATLLGADLSNALIFTVR